MSILVLTMSAMILTLLQVDTATEEVSKTTLNIVDLAGAERPSSNGEEHTSAISAIMDYWRGVPVTTGGQGTIIQQREERCVQSCEREGGDVCVCESVGLGGWEQYCTPLVSIHLYP